MFPDLTNWVVGIGGLLGFLALCIFAKYVVKRASQGQPLIPNKIKEEDFVRARPGLSAPLPDKEIINTPIKVVISFDEKGQKFLNLDIIMIRKSLKKSAKRK